MHPDIGFEFSKGYYARLSHQMHGRVTRLLMTPLVRALQSMVGFLPFLVYLDSFRYPLAGEFAMQADLARVNRLPSDWGLEVGTLAEVYRNCSIVASAKLISRKTTNTNIQELSHGDPSKGLMKMAMDICKSLFRILAAEGVKFDHGLMLTLLVRYQRMAENNISKYHADAMINGLTFDRHEEETAVETFSQALKLASEKFCRSFGCATDSELDACQRRHCPRSWKMCAESRGRGQRGLGERGRTLGLNQTIGTSRDRHPSL